MSDAKKSEDTIFHHLAVVTAMFGKPALAAVDRVQEFVEKYNPITGTPETTKSLYSIGVVGTHIFVTPTGSKDPRKDAVLAIDMSQNYVFIDAMGMFGKVKTAEEHHAKHAARMEKLKEIFKDDIEERKAEIEAQKKNELFDKFDKDDSSGSKLH